MAAKMTVKKTGVIDLVAKFGITRSEIAQISTWAGLPPNKDASVAMGAFLLPAKSTLEAKFRALGKGLVQDHTGQKVVFSAYEWLSFKLPGGSYKGDYYYMLGDGTWVVVDVKAPNRAAFVSYRGSFAKMRAAATLHPYARFIMAMPDKTQPSGWLLKDVPRDQEFMITLNMMLKDGAPW